MRSTQSHFPGQPAKRLTLLISVRDHVRHASLQMEVLKRARKAKLAGATVFEGVEGFGTSGRVHREHVISDDRPLAIVIIDHPERIDAFLEEIAPILDDVVVTVDVVEVLDRWGS